MSAAATAAQEGLSVLLLDEQPQAGGQIFRNVENHVSDHQVNQLNLGKEYAAGSLLVKALSTPNIKTEYQSTVWRIDAGKSFAWSQNGVSHLSYASQVLLAVGAQERPMTFPGWTLPGEMSAGAAQILMKSSRLLARESILVGSGPLLYLVAAQLIDADAPPKALVETQTKAMWFSALKHLPKALPASSTLKKGIGLLRKIRTAGIPRYLGARQFKVTANDEGTLELLFQSKQRKHKLLTPNILIHQGVVPSTHMSRAAGVIHEWNEVQQAIQPKLDEWGRTDMQGLHIAGDNAGIGGADVAQATGCLSALDVLHLLGRLNEGERDVRSHSIRIELQSALAIRPCLDAAYAPSAECLVPVDDTIVCRCEEVTAKQIRQSVTQGASGPRQVKTAVRAGMGPCQGRMCDLTVRAILSDYGVATPIPNARSPIKPVKLGELALLSTDQ